MLPMAKNLIIFVRFPNQIVINWILGCIEGEHIQFERSNKTEKFHKCSTE